MSQGFWAFITAVASGLFGCLLLFFQARTRRSTLETAWQAQAQQLIEKMGEDRAEVVALLQGQMLAKDVENARLVAALLRREGSNDSGGRDSATGANTPIE